MKKGVEVDIDIKITIIAVSGVVLFVGALAGSCIQDSCADKREKKEIVALCEIGPEDIRYDCKAFGTDSNIWDSSLCLHCKRDEHRMCDKDDWNRKYIIKHCFLKDLEE